MLYFYNLILYRPFLNALIYLYNTIAFNDLGLAIIFLTILIRLLLFPIFHKSARHQMVMQVLQPELKKIQEVHKRDREKQTQAMLELYKRHNINPLSGFFLLLVQLPILIALYQIILKSLRPEFLSGLYSFVGAPAAINPAFLGLINLSGRSIIVVVLAALAQYFQGKLALLPVAGSGASADPSQKMARNMVFMGPIITLVIFYNLPAAIGLYWFVTSLFSVFQQIIINNQRKNGKLGSTGQKNN